MIAVLFFLVQSKVIKNILDTDPVADGLGGYMQDGDYYIRNSKMHKMLGIDMSLEELIEKYGEENAHYIFESLSQRTVATIRLFI